MNIFFSVLAVILLLLMCGDKNEANRKNFTAAFIAVIIGVVLLKVIPMMFPVIYG